MSSTGAAPAGGAAASGGAAAAIDRDQYSRQLYVYGEGVMQRMAKSHVLVAGMDGIGVETAKNVALAGVQTLTVMDHVTATLDDLATQFYLTEADVSASRNRAEASQERLAELNRYTQVQCSTQDVSAVPLEFFQQFHCVVLCGAPQATAQRVDEFCRAHGVPFLACESRGFAGYVFGDFGDSFVSSDALGIDPARFDIASITNDEDGVVTLRGNHSFQAGVDEVLFDGVGGMRELNGTRRRVQRVIDRTSFTIGDTRALPAFTGYGECVEVIQPTTFKHEPLAQQLRSPTVSMFDFMKDGVQTVLGTRALHEFAAANGGRMPRAWHDDDAAAVLAIAQRLGKEMHPPVEPSAAFVSKLAKTATGGLSGLTGVLGSVAAQEAIKAVGGKYTPLTQWLALDLEELVPEAPSEADVARHNDRYDAQRVVLGDTVQAKLLDFKCFMVGAGAIGCEMLKYYALMGMGAGASGSIVMTDPDAIEKSNLNRQFLFRAHDINSNKAEAAAAAIVKMNPALQVAHYSHKVGPDTENIFTERFFEGLDVVVNALDNVQARAYVDNRCILAQRPLMESGTMGTQGHTQPIVPFLTESYTSFKPPAGKDTAPCTVKLFPEKIEHTIQWARARFENEFSERPVELLRFVSEPDYLEQVERAKGPVLKILKHVVQYLETFREMSDAEFVTFARAKFDRLLNFNIRNLLLTRPADYRNDKGELFWEPPKRVPKPIEFNAADATHVDLVVAIANLVAHIFGRPAIVRARVVELLASVQVPSYVPKPKDVAADPTAAPAAPTERSRNATPEHIAALRARATALAEHVRGSLSVAPEHFEKDVDSNHHIAFVTAASNLRARSHDIGEIDFMTTKRIAGNIIPAIATTTSCVSGLVAIEIVKLCKGVPLSQYRQAQVNLALPTVFGLEPREVRKVEFRPGLKFSMWDRFDYRGGDATIGELVQWFKDEYGLEVSALVQNKSLLYAPIVMDNLEEQRAKRVMSLVDVPRRAPYVYLDVAFDGVADDGMQSPPKLRFYVPAAKPRARPTAAAAAAQAASS